MPAWLTFPRCATASEPGCAGGCRIRSSAGGTPRARDSPRAARSSAVPPSVRVIGDALLDVHVTPSAPLEPGSDRAAEVRLEPGGQGANLAVRLARRGVPVRLICALADDTAGAMVRAALGSDGVEVDAREVPMTGVVVVLVAADGGRTMLSQRVRF